MKTLTLTLLCPFIAMETPRIHDGTCLQTGGPPSHVRLVSLMRDEILLVPPLIPVQSRLAVGSDAPGSAVIGGGVCDVTGGTGKQEGAAGVTSTISFHSSQPSDVFGRVPPPASRQP